MDVPLPAQFCLVSGKLDRIGIAAGIGSRTPRVESGKSSLGAEWSPCGRRWLRGDVNEHEEEEEDILAAAAFARLKDNCSILPHSVRARGGFVPQRGIRHALNHQVFHH